MIQKEDKDAIIAHLVETLNVIRGKLDDTPLCRTNSLVREMVKFDIVDYIDHRLMDVAF